MKLLALLGAGLIAAGTVAAAPASAQYHGHGYGRHQGYGQGDGYRHGYGDRGRHAGWRGHHERCRVIYRHGYRSRRCY